LQEANATIASTSLCGLDPIMTYEKINNIMTKNKT